MRQNPPEARTTNYTWDYNVLSPTVITEADKTTTRTYENGRVKTVTITDTTPQATPYPVAGRTRQWGYTYSYFDVDQRQVASIEINGPRIDINDTSRYEYNTSGFLTLYRNAEGHTWQITQHFDDGAPKTIEAPNNVVIQLTYTARGLLDSREIFADGIIATTDFEYYDNQLLKQITLSTGAQYNFEYDDAQRVTKVTDKLNNVAAFELTPLGDRKKVTIIDSGESKHFELVREFDDLGRLWKILGLDSETRTELNYDKNNNATSVIDGLSQTTTRIFDGLDRFIGLIDRATNTVDLTHNTSDQVTSVTDQNNLTTSYIYDGFGFLLQTNSPDTGVRTFWRDEAGNLKRSVDARNQEKTFTYDANNRTATVSYTGSADKNLALFYDESITYGETNAGVGRLTRVEQADGQNMGFIYNQRGLLTKQVTIIGGMSYTTQYTYTLGADIETISYASGVVVTYQYNAQGQVNKILVAEPAQAITTLADAITYKPFGAVTSLKFANNLTQTKSFDLHYRVNGATTADGSTNKMDWEIGHNVIGNIHPIVDKLNASGTQNFGYNALNQLTTAESNLYGDYTFDYDPVGNRSVKTWNKDAESQSETFISDSTTTNRLSSIERIVNAGAPQTIDYDYNNSGSTTAAGTRSFSIDENERTEEILENGVLVATYFYNGLGQRIQKIVEGNDEASRQFIYNTQGQLLSELSSTGQPIRDYIYLDSTLISMVDAQSTGLADVSVKLVGKDGKYKKDTKTITYNVEVLNQGVADATNVRLTNTLPLDASISSITTDVGVCDSNTLVCQLGLLASNQTAIVSIVVTSDNDKKMDFSAEVTTDTTDINVDNNSLTKGFGGAFGVWLLAALGILALVRKAGVNKKALLTMTGLGLMASMLFNPSSVHAEVFYVSTDHRGAPQVITDNNQNTVWEGSYHPFGNVDITTSVIENNVRFPGQYFDQESGLHYNYYRDYDPGLGRYLQSDPIGLGGGLNTYGYGYQNPVSNIDPDGRFAICLAVPYLAEAVAVAGAAVLTAIANEVTNDIINEDRRHSPDRQALNDIINGETNGGRAPLSDSDADTILDWAGELGIGGTRDDRGKDHWAGGEHIHVPGSGQGHIPTE